MKENIQITSIQHFIEENGYYTEAHEVQTDDGYILTLTRLLKKSENLEKVPNLPKKKKPVALFAPGLMCQADHFCMIERKFGLPYKLLDEGYDCWLLNYRGIALSRKHVSLSTSSKRYWDFSFHELGIFDLPATIDYILKITENSSLSYIGHSMGCTILFVLLSIKPEYCSKVNVMFALAPAVYGAHITNLGLRFCTMFANAVSHSKLIRRREVSGTPASKFMKYLAPKSKRDRLAAWFLLFFGRIVGGFGKHGIEKERLCRLANSWPSPSSLQVVCHGFQCLKSNQARQYNYGRAGNLKMYGQPKPPLYDMGKVNVPVAIICSAGDQMCTPSDIAKLSKELPNVIHHFCVNDDDFSHVDFMVGKDAHKLVYKKVIQVMNQIKNNND